MASAITKSKDAVVTRPCACVLLTVVTSSPITPSHALFQAHCSLRYFSGTVRHLPHTELLLTLFLLPGTLFLQIFTRCLPHFSGLCSSTTLLLRLALVTRIKIITPSPVISTDLPCLMLLSICQI